jgi:8-amino-7-oxononanoate synthase
VKVLSAGQVAWQDASRAFRARLNNEGWSVAAGDSPIVPVRLGRAEDALGLAAELRERGILAGAVRPPTVPAGTSRLRFSLKRTFDTMAEDRVLAAMNAWRAGR